MNLEHDGLYGYTVQRTRMNSTPCCGQEKPDVTKAGQATVPHRPCPGHSYTCP